MTSKERAQFRAQANTLEPLFQIGKGGIGDNMIKQLYDALEKLKAEYREALYLVYFAGVIVLARFGL